MTRFKLFAAMLAVMGLALPFAAAAEEAPGTFKITATDTTVKFYGYVQLDATYDFKGRDPNVEGDDWATTLATIPLDDSFETRNKAGQLYLTARTSRIGVTTTTPTGVGTIGTKLEGDFNGANLESGQTFTNSVLFRLRHAYGTVSGGAGTLLVGQTWSTFLDLAAYPDVVDFNGPGSIALVRNPMIRYTTPTMNGFTLALALENAPGTDGNDFSGSAGITKYQQIPDIHANLGYSGSWGSVSARAVLQNFKRAAPVPPASNLGADSHSKEGYGLGLSGAFKIMGDTLVAQVVGGGGIGRYMLNGFFAAGGTPFVDTGTDLFLWDAAAYHVGYTHVWNPEWRSNVVWSQTFLKPNPAAGNIEADGTLSQRMDQLFVNTFWTFAKNAELGLEYEYGQRHTFSDAANPERKGTQHRITSTFHVNFY